MKRVKMICLICAASSISRGRSTIGPSAAMLGILRSRPATEGCGNVEPPSRNVGAAAGPFCARVGGSLDFGITGQANYSAANAFLDAFTHYRRAQGLPCLTINSGIWGSEGMASRVTDTHLASTRTPQAAGGCRARVHGTADG